MTSPACERVGETEPGKSPGAQSISEPVAGCIPARERLLMGRSSSPLPGGERTWVLGPPSGSLSGRGPSPLQNRNGQGSSAREEVPPACAPRGLARNRKGRP